MPAGPGETLLCTVYADVHYFFADPSQHPSHHRFDKGSYAYVFNNPSQQTAKLEVANHAGTPHQDAFSGYLNVCRLSYSYKQPCLVTLTIDPNYALDQSHWCLPTFNERNEQKYLYKIHTLDIYLWTEKDASAFLTHLKAAMPSDRLEIKDIPNQNGSDAAAGLSEHRDSMSPVVQQLEKTAIGSVFPPRAESTVSAHSFPGPPTPATNIASPQPQKALGTAGPPVQSPPPMAYNPAAPPAPEPIAHREKTPPPPDGSVGTGLAAAEKHEAVPQTRYSVGTPGFGGFQVGQQPAQSQGYFPGPPGNVPTQGMSGLPQSGIPPPPPGGPPGQQPPQFAGPPQMSSPAPTSPPPHQQSFQRVPSFQTQSQTPGPTQFASYPQSPGFAPSLQSPGGPPTFHQQGQQPPTPSMPPPYSGGGLQSYQQQAQAFQQQQQQTFAYSNYSYSSQPAGQPQGYNTQGGYSGDVHGQVYRPTEQETTAHGKTYHPAEPTRWTQAQQPPSGGPIPQQGTGGSVNSTGSQGSGGFKLEERVGKMEKGVNKLFRKLDSKW